MAPCQLPPRESISLMSIGWDGLPSLSIYIEVLINIGSSMILYQKRWWRNWCKLCATVSAQNKRVPPKKAEGGNERNRRRERDWETLTWLTWPRHIWPSGQTAPTACCPKLKKAEVTFVQIQYIIRDVKWDEFPFYFGQDRAQTGHYVTLCTLFL